MLDLSGSASSLESDAASARTNGGYTRFNLNLGRTQALPANFSLSVVGSAQISLNNLDSSEKFSLGGPSGVRAYPGGEANADEGYLVSAEIRYDIPPFISISNLQLFGFYDHGGVISLHKNNWSGWQGSNPDLSSHYDLDGAGIGLSVSQNGLFAIRANWAWKVGGNPGSTNGLDSNGKNDIGQLWLQGSFWF